MSRWLLLLLLLSQAGASGALVNPIWKVRERRAGDAHYAIDSSGSTYLAKWSYSHDQTLTIVKRNSRGQRVWSTSRRHEAFPRDIAVDSAGNVYVTGGQYNFGNPTNFEDTVTWRFDRSGRLRWRVVFQGPDNTDDSAAGIGVDDGGRIYVAGNSASRFGPIPTNSSFFVQYDSSGNAVWTRQFGSEFGGVQTLAVNPEGGIAGIGRRSAITLSQEADLLWWWQATNTFRSGFDSTSFKIAGFDHDDQLYLAGLIETGRGVFLPVVQKFSWAGEILWTAAYHGPAENAGEDLDLRIDAQGNAYLGLEDAIACEYRPGDDGSELDCAYRPTLIQFNSNGDLQWASHLAPNAPHVFHYAGMALNPTGGVNVSLRAVAYDPAADDVTSHDTFLVQYDANGNQIWNAQFHYRDERDLWALPPGTDAKGFIYAPAELIDRSNVQNELDFLLARFYPFRLHGAPRMLLQPSRQTVVEGGTVTIEADASGKGNIRYQWRLNGDPLPGQTKRVLQLEVVRLNQAGDYSVEARNFLGTIISPEARLTVLPAVR